MITENHMEHILFDWVKSDSDRRSIYQYKVNKWIANFPIPKKGDFVIHNGVPLVVIDYGIKLNVFGFYERCVWVLKNNKPIKLLGFECFETKEKEKLSLKEIKMLKQAFKKEIEKEYSKKCKRIKGHHLLKKMKLKVEEKKLNIKKMSLNYKITGSQKRKAVYLSIRGGRIDLCGFEILHEAIIKFSKKTIKEKNLGRITSTIDLTKNDEKIMNAFDKSLEALI